MLKATKDFIYAGALIKAGQTLRKPELEAFFVARGLAEVVPDTDEAESPHELAPVPVEEQLIKPMTKGKAKLDKRSVANKAGDQ